MSGLAILTTVPPQKQVLVDDLLRPIATDSCLAGAVGGLFAVVALRATLEGLLCRVSCSCSRCRGARGRSKRGQGQAYGAWLPVRIGRFLGELDCAARARIRPMNAARAGPAATGQPSDWSDSGR